MPFPQSQDELNSHLAEQIAFLEASILSYDSGNTSEAKRLASTLRLMLHDTRNSKSLLGQLGLKILKFCDTSNYSGYNATPWDVAVYTGLVGQCINMAKYRVEFVPLLDHESENGPIWVDFEHWWSTTVIKDELRNTFSRRDLVLTMADQDGGAHIDPVITDKYAALSRQNSVGWVGAVGNTDYRPIPYPERAAVRQIAHELLKTLNPSYSKKPELEQPSFIAYNIIVLLEPLQKKFGRNEPCPCGSGKKYKQCHGDA